jgi:hypothetical protein
LLLLCVLFCFCRIAFTTSQTESPSATTIIRRSAGRRAHLRPLPFYLGLHGKLFSQFFKFSKLSPRLWMMQIASAAYTICDCSLDFIRPFGVKKHKIHPTLTDRHVECVCVCVICCAVFDAAVPLLFRVGVLLLFLLLLFLCSSVLFVSSCCLGVLGCPLHFIGHLRGRFLVIFLCALCVSTLCSVICLFLLFCFPLFGVLFGCVVAALRVLCLVNIPDYTCPGLVKCQSGTNIIRNNLKDILFLPKQTIWYASSW